MNKVIVIATFYKFVRLPDYAARQKPLLNVCRAAEVKGTILLAEEGINATIAGPRAGIDRVMGFLRAEPRFADIEVKESVHDEIPFRRLKVRLKSEIAALKAAGANPNEEVGTYVEAEEWNRLIAQEDVILIDARNDYEVRMGSFRQARNPEIKAFNELPGYIAEQLDASRDKRVAMFCTGGIRCEKATAWMLRQGFEEVFHLKGGILRYLERIDPTDSWWEGECFVFDERVTVDHHLRKGSIRICDDCKSMVGAAAQECPVCGSTNFL